MPATPSYILGLPELRSDRREGLRARLQSVTPAAGGGGRASRSIASSRHRPVRSRPHPAPLPTAIIPEPATWGLLVVGFGLVGLQGRRRSRSTSVAA